MTPLSRAITIAVQAHDGQVDKAGQPYVLHPLRVMLAMETEDERIVAVLHDVLEDRRINLGELILSGNCPLGASGIADLYALSRGPGETHSAYIDRVARSPVATRVKIADLRDNLRKESFHVLTDSHRARYVDALNRLLAVANEGSAS